LFIEDVAMIQEPRTLSSVNITTNYFLTALVVLC